MSPCSGPCGILVGSALSAPVLHMVYDGYTGFPDFRSMLGAHGMDCGTVGL